MKKTQLLWVMLIFCIGIAFPQEVNVYTVLGENSPLSDGIVLDENGNMYICDAVGSGSPQNPLGTIVSKITPELEISTYVTGMQIPIGNCLDEEGNLYVSNLNGYLKKVTSTGSVSNFGNIFCAIGMVFDSSGNLYVAQPNSEGMENNFIKKVTSAGISSTVYEGDPLYFVYGMAMDEDDQLYAGNFSNGNIYKFDTINMTDPELVGTIPDAIWGCAGFMEYYDEYLYIGGYWQHVVYRMNVNTGETIVLAGTGDEGMVDGPAALAQFYKPNGIAIREAGNDLEIYVTDDGNKSLRKIVISNYNLGVENQMSNPNRISLSNFPNPFNPSTEIRFQISDFREVENAEIEIYNLKGQIIRTIPNLQIIQSQNHKISWNGTNQAGEPVTSGIYFARLKASDIEASCKMLLLK